MAVLAAAVHAHAMADARYEDALGRLRSLLRAPHDAPARPWLARAAPARPPYTEYELPADPLWPDWDFDRGKAHAAGHAQPVQNGWEQAMWGPFVADLRTPLPVDAVVHAYDGLDWRSYMLRAWPWRRRKTEVRRAPSVWQSRRDEAVALLEQVAFEREHDAASVIHASFAMTNETAPEADALWVLGEISLWGTHGLAPDLPRALRAFEQLAMLGNASAHARLGYLYSSPVLAELYGTSLRPERSLLHTLQAAQEGVRGAQLAVAHKYERGAGVPVDCVEAMHWYDAAARQSYARYAAGPPGGRTLPYSKIRLSDRAALPPSGVLPSGFNDMLFTMKLHRPALQRLLRQEPHALQDPARLHGVLEAYEHQEGAARVPFLAFLAYAYYRGSVVAASESLGAVQRNYSHALQLASTVASLRWPKPATLEDPSGPSRRPDGTVQRAYTTNDVDKALVVHTANAALLLGQMHLRGEGTTQDVVQAKVWLTRAALDGNGHAFALVAEMAHEGWGGLANAAMAAQLYEHRPKDVLAPDMDVARAKRQLRAHRPAAALDALTTAKNAALYGSAYESALLESAFEVRYWSGAVRADWAFAGNRTAAHCTLAVPDLRYAADRADWDDPVYARGMAAYARNDLRTALHAWSIAAWQGTEEAQDNLAYMLDPTRAYLYPLPPRATDRVALRYWLESSVQGSPYALLKVCDYMRLARGIPADPARAMQCYEALADNDSAALAPRWRLAQLYEAGAGDGPRDFPLAKRYYDTILTWAPNAAVLTAFPALVRLHLRALVAYWQGDVTADRLLRSYFGALLRFTPAWTWLVVPTGLGVLALLYSLRMRLARDREAVATLLAQRPT